MSHGDWRMRGQELYLNNKTLFQHDFIQWSSLWDHEHCAFCWNTFRLSQGGLKFGYSTLDNYYWICEGCFEDFRKAFSLSIYYPTMFCGKDAIEIFTKEIGDFRGHSLLFEAVRMIHLLNNIREERIMIPRMQLIPTIVEISPDRLVEASLRPMSNNIYTIESGNACEVITILNQIVSGVSLPQKRSGNESKLFIQIAA